MPHSTPSTIIVDPMVNVNYVGFYILGLFEKFGLKNIKFSNKPFRGLKTELLP